MRFEIRIRRWLFPFLLAAVAGCAGIQARPETEVTGMPAEVRSDLTVSGDIRVRGEAKVYPGAVLNLRPGTHIYFEPWDPDGDGINDSRLVIEGRMVARGEPDAPIFFSSAAKDPEPGDWLELRIDRSDRNVMEHCVLQHSRYGLHVHFSSGLVVSSVFRNNIDGTRFGNSHFEFASNLVQDNEAKGINLRDSRIMITDNRFEGNGHGIFLSDKAGGSTILSNLFTDNRRSDIRFGDFYEGGPPDLMDNRSSGPGPLNVAGFEGEIDPGGTIEGLHPDQ